MPYTKSSRVVGWISYNLAQSTSKASLWRGQEPMNVPISLKMNFKSLGFMVRVGYLLPFGNGLHHSLI